MVFVTDINIDYAKSVKQANTEKPHQLIASKQANIEKPHQLIASKQANTEKQHQLSSSKCYCFKF